jgi:hypothetical protein
MQNHDAQTELSGQRIESRNYTGAKRDLYQSNDSDYLKFRRQEKEQYALNSWPAPPANVPFISFLHVPCNSSPTAASEFGSQKFFQHIPPLVLIVFLIS